MAKRRPATTPERDQLRAKQLDVKQVAKHLPDTRQAERLIEKEGAAHVFLDEATMHAVVGAIIDRGVRAGSIRGHERCGLWFQKPIGNRIDLDGSRLPLYYGELKVRGDYYHAIPRTGPSSG